MIAPQKGDFFRVRLNGRSRLVEIASVRNDGLISGWLVRKSGERAETETKDAVIQHLAIFRLDDLRQRLQMNHFYAELENAS